MDKGTRRIFGWCLFFCGLLFLFVTPPFQVADEINHFLRACQIARNVPIAWRNGRIGGEFPHSLAASTQAFAGVPFHSDTRVSAAQWKAAWARFPTIDWREEPKDFVDLFNTVIYSPLPYVPQILGIAVGGIFGARPFTLLYLARLFNLLTFIGLAIVALRELREDPRTAGFFAFLFALPMALSLGASASPDAMTIALCALVLVLGMQLVDHYDGRRFRMALAAIVGLGLCKPVYWPFGLFLALAVVYGAPYFMRTRHVLSILVGTFTPFLIWSFIANHRYTPAPFPFVVDPHAQASLFLHHPFRVGFSLLRDLFSQYAFLKRSFFGHFGWLDAPLSKRAISVWSTLFLAVLFVSPRPPRLLPSALRGALLASLCASLALLCISLFMAGVEAGQEHLPLLQGRYFIPEAFALPLLLPALRWPPPNRQRIYFGLIAGLMLVFELQAVVTVWKRFWG